MKKFIIPILVISYAIAYISFFYNPSHTDGPYRESDASASIWYVGS